MKHIKVNRQIARIAEVQQQEQEQQEKSLMLGFLWGLGGDGSERSYPNPEDVLSDSEIAFLSEMRELEIREERDACELAEAHGLSKARYLELDGEVFHTLKAGEAALLDQIADGGLSVVDTREKKIALASLTDRGFIETFNKQDKRFLERLGGLEVEGPESIKLRLHRTAHDIDDKKWQRWQRTGIVHLPTEGEKKWLRGVKNGLSLEVLEALADSQELSGTWHLKDRIEILNDGRRKINAKPRTPNDDFIIPAGAKINWYEKGTDREVSATTVCRKDLNTINSSGTSFWTKTRQAALAKRKETAPEQFNGQLFGLCTHLERVALLSESEEDLSARQIDFRQRNLQHFNLETLKQFRRETLSNEEYFFLAAVKREPEDMTTLSGVYGADPAHLKAQGYLDYLEESEKEVLKKCLKGEEELESDEEDIVEELRARYFLISPTHAESSFLCHVNDHGLESIDEIVKAGDLFMLPEKQVMGLKSRGFLDCLSENERRYLEELHQAPEASKEELAEKYDIDKPWFLDERIGAERLDLSTKVDLDEKFRFNPRVQYRETRDLIQERQNRPMTISPRLKAKDTATYFKHIAGEELGLGQFERVSELLASGINPEALPIVSNTEKAFLDKIAWKKYDEDLFKKIAKDDFGLCEETFDRLRELGFTRLTSKEKVLPYSEPEIIQKARIYSNSTVAERKRLELERPDEKILQAVAAHSTPATISPKLMDYEIYFKTLRGENPKKGEVRRIEFLRENGMHPEGSKFRCWLKTEPKSWRMQTARRNAYLNHYDKEYGVDLEVLKFINTFKQATHDQILAEGLSPDQLERYHKGIKGGHQLLKKNILLHQGGPITYYSLTHEGPISGRKYLERDGAKKSEIAKRPQRRADLLYHDLRVVDCVQKVREWKENKGKQLTSMTTESKQFSEAKKGKSNDQRQGGPSFMDAQLVFEEEGIEGQKGGGSSETIAVEYGNYTLERMTAKLENCEFDHAYIFAKPEYTKRYEKHINVPNVTFIAMR